MGDAGSATALPAFTFTNTINGQAHTSSNVAHHVNPLDKSKLWEVPVATKADLDEAVASAKEAFKVWSKVSWEERAKVLGEVKKVLEENRAELTQILILEGGKPVDVAAGEVWASGFSLEWHSQQPNPAPEVLQDDDSLKLTMSWIPLGVTAAICPWNFPLILSVQKIAAALLTGNTMIVKPSPFTPYSILYLVSRIQHLFPHGGCVQALNGDGGLGPAITTHPGIEKISFTGSIATGKRVMAAAAGTLKRVTLELGGNSACIVLPDVDIAKVAPLVAIGAFYNSGQLCVASKRLYVHKDIYEEFRDAVVAVVKGWQVGGGGKMNLGPVQNGMQYEIVKKYFEDCAVNGYEFCLGGKVGDKGGYVIEPAILDNPPENSRIVKEEPFGPIVPMMPWCSEEELLERVNDTRTGLGGAIYGADIERAERIAGQIESGTVWINGPERPLAQAYFSGHKESGMGGEGGRKGLEAYMNAQVVHLYKGDVGKSSKL